MFKQILQNIDGFVIWAILTMFFFIAVFAFVWIKTIKADKDELKRISELPLE